MVDDTYDTAPSVLLENLLPSLVHQRIPKFRSLRRVLSQYNSTPTAHSRGLSQSSIDSITPPPSYRADSVTSESADESHYLSGTMPAAYSSGFSSGSFPFPSLSSPPTRPSSSASVLPAYTGESKSGIQWKYADPGFALLSLSSQEAASAGGGFARSSVLIRRQYIDGLCCMLRGLPSDLSLEEEVSIRDALPASLASTIPVPPTSASPNDEDCANLEKQVLIRSAQTSKSLSPSPPLRPSALHRMTASMTLYLVLLISFLLPYFHALLKQAYLLDRKHHISDRLLAQGVVAADSARRATMQLATNICAMNDGKVGEAVRDLGVYAVQGFSAGVYDGVGEGMQILGLRRAEMVAAERKGLAARGSVTA